MAFGSLSPFLSRCSSSAAASSAADPPDFVPRRTFSPEFEVVKKRQFGISPEQRVECPDFSSKKWKIQRTNSTIVRDFNSEVDALVGSDLNLDSVVLDSKQAKEDGYGEKPDLKCISSSHSVLPTSLQAQEITQETYKITEASLEDSAAVISTDSVCGHDYNKEVLLNQDKRLNSILKRKSNGHNNHGGGGGTDSVKQAKFQGPSCIKGFNGDKKVENAAGRAQKCVTFDITCKDDSNRRPMNLQGGKYTADRNVRRRKKVQISSETLSALNQLARLITNVQKERRRKIMELLRGKILNPLGRDC